VGFAIQGLINGGFVRALGVGNLTWRHHLVLAPVAAGAQTLGKILAIALIFRIHRALTRAQAVRFGLLVGLGFAIWEITVIWYSVVRSEGTLEWLSVWERATASCFHIYTAGLVALALWSRKYWPIVLVVALHAATDFLAANGQVVTSSIHVLESIFSAAAVVVWVVFLTMDRAERGFAKK